MQDKNVTITSEEYKHFEQCEADLVEYKSYIRLVRVAWATIIIHLLIKVTERFI